MPFDPFGWASRAIPERPLHRLLQLFLAALCAALVLVRLRAYGAYGSKLLWWGETSLFACFGAGFLLRAPPLRRARGLAELAVPLIASLIPFALVHWPRPGGGGIEWALTPAWGALADSPGISALLLGLIALGHFWAAAGTLSLRRSFSIAPEARRLETSGAYRFCRHPIYAGEILASSVIALIRLCPRNAALLAAFIAMQVWRAKKEEEVLCAAFPGYGRYREGRGLFFP